MARAVRANNEVCLGYGGFGKLRRLRKLMLSKRLWWLLFGVNALALIFIAQINLGVIPTFPASWNFSMSAGVDKFNALVSDLSQGVIISSLFFVLLVYVPIKQKSEKFFEAAKMPAGAILSSLEDILEQITFREGGGGETTEIDLKACANSSPPSNKNQIFGVSGKKLKLLDVNSGECTLEKDFIDAHLSLIKYYCQLILEHPFISSDLTGLGMSIFEVSQFAAVRNGTPTETTTDLGIKLNRIAWTAQVRDLISAFNKLKSYKITYL
ncbi:hypothetical protein [Rheinheimera sp.]|uniref:hypothetical protein n=1 Tax=Rheinheimera sp. TaxID=1869214 RepID=UPI002631B6B0|nr:hypothetical protein [Rheinheimera sp.]MCA1931262.1 hypothetical protein [Rheinheimera sp.]